MTARPAWRLAGATLCAVLAAACAGADGGGGRQLADVVAAEVVATTGEVDVPPRDADLAAAGWHETAAWIAREAEAGRPLVLNVFASWCEPCKEEAPILGRLAAELTQVTFLGVAHQDRLDAARGFVREHELPYPTLYDFGGEVARAVGSHGMPTTAFFDREGRLVGLHVGPLSEAELRGRIGELVAAAP